MPHAYFGLVEDPREIIGISRECRRFGCDLSSGPVASQSSYALAGWRPTAEPAWVRGLKRPPDFVRLPVKSLVSILPTSAEFARHPASKYHRLVKVIDDTAMDERAVEAFARSGAWIRPLNITTAEDGRLLATYASEYAHVAGGSFT